eukprot:Polyplicarium_translucidae@DN2665_c0_g1_i2.p1
MGRKCCLSSSAGSVVQLANGKSLQVWPDHCVQHSGGAALHADLRRRPSDIVVVKGHWPDEDSLSGFGTATHPTPLLEHLKSVDEVLVCGLAFDYCVAATALDAAKNGLAVTVVEDATAAICPESASDALGKMRAAGVKVLTTAQAISAQR